MLRSLRHPRSIPISFLFPSSSLLFQKARLALSKGASGTESPPMRGDPTEGVLIVTPAEVAAATFLATKAKAYTSVPEDQGVDGLNANEEEVSVSSGRRNDFVL